MNKPATYITWNEAARFVNWLNTSTGHHIAYLFGDDNINSNITLWSSGEAWQLGGENLYRHKGAYYFLPSEDEWYKSAYYDGNTMVYYDYATGSDTAPTAVANGTTDGTAVYDGQSGPADITDAGGLSPYGTMAQNGNAFEWVESAWVAPNDSATELRARRGGSWNDASGLDSSYRAFFLPETVGAGMGFRVASLPEPSSVTLLGFGGLGLLLRRRR